MKIKMLSAALLSAVMLGSPASADFNDGFVAYGKGDYSTALKEWKPLAEQGDAVAQYNLGVMYDNGHGVTQDHKKAVDWYTKAAEQGNASAQNNLGVMYENGHGVTQDHKKAVEWYTKAAELGNAGAQNNLGQMYRIGQGVPQGYKKAFEWYTKAAEQGKVLAQYNLGVMYQIGQGVPQDYKKAFEWYTKAAEHGKVLAQYNLGQMYLIGQGVPQDYKKAFEWYTKAAEQGNADAQYNLGVMYENGHGVKQDHKKAVEWYTKAAEQGNVRAKNNLVALESLMKCSNPSANDTQLFGIALNCANRESLRQAVKKAGGIVKKEDLNSWGDTYYSSSLLKDSSELFVSYTVDDKGFALALYTFPSTLDTSQVSRVRDLVASKYGSPVRSTGNVNLGHASFTWNLKDGIELTVSRGWPDTTTYLTYKHVKNYAEQQAEMERQKRAAEAKVRASQSTNF